MGHVFLVANDPHGSNHWIAMNRGGKAGVTFSYYAASDSKDTALTPTFWLIEWKVGSYDLLVRKLK